MKPLLFDQNLSPRLVDFLSVEFPNSIHVQNIGLGHALDRQVWEYAQQRDVMIVTKDADFGELGVLLGFPPKVIWIRRGNCSTQEIVQLLSEYKDAIERLSTDENAGVLELF